MNKETKDKIVDMVDKDNGFIASNDYKLLEINEEYCIFEGNISNSSLNPYNIAHGGYIFGLADTCAGVLACVDGNPAVTTNASISFIKKAVGKSIVAKATFLKKGKTLSNIEVEVRDCNNDLVSKVLFEYFYI